MGWVGGADECMNVWMYGCMGWAGRLDERCMEVG